MRVETETRKESLMDDSEDEEDIPLSRRDPILRNASDI
jgi:hypothetical protein